MAQLNPFQEGDAKARDRAHATKARRGLLAGDLVRTTKGWPTPGAAGRDDREVGPRKMAHPAGEAMVSVSIGAKGRARRQDDSPGGGQAARWISASSAAIEKCRRKNPGSPEGCFIRRCYSLPGTPPTGQER